MSGNISSILRNLRRLKVTSLRNVRVGRSEGETLFIDLKLARRTGGATVDGSVITITRWTTAAETGLRANTIQRSQIVLSINGSTVKATKRAGWTGYWDGPNGIVVEICCPDLFRISTGDGCYIDPLP